VSGEEIGRYLVHQLSIDRDSFTIASVRPTDEDFVRIFVLSEADYELFGLLRSQTFGSSQIFFNHVARQRLMLVGLPVGIEDERILQLPWAKQNCVENMMRDAIDRTKAIIIVKEEKDKAALLQIGLIVGLLNFRI
jgi:hypothetical protein